MPAVQRARRRVRRRRHHDQGHARRRRLAGQRAEGLDERRPRRRRSAWPRSAPTRTCRSTRASRRWSSTCTRKGVEVRPLKMATGGSEFNEVFFNDVFVPDDDVIGPVDNGWTVARATLGNESVSIGGGPAAAAATPDKMIIALARRAPRAPPRRRAARRHATSPSTTRWRCSTCAPSSAPSQGSGPGPEGNDHQARAVRAGPRGDGDPSASSPVRTRVHGRASAALAGWTGAVAPRPCRSPAARRRSSATRSASASSACRATR